MIASEMLRKLSPTERKVLELFINGDRRQEIAKKLGIARGTVSWHMDKIFEKLDCVRSRRGVMECFGTFEIRFLPSGPK